MKFDFDVFRNVVPTAAIMLGLTALPALADEDDEEGPGVPHIVVLDNGGAIELEFELVPAPEVNGVPTQTLFLPFNPGDSAFVSNPVNGLADGFLNDDTGFESEEELVGSDITVTLNSVLSSDADFSVLLGSEVITSLGDTPFNEVNAFSLGSAFDDHPTFFIFETDPTFVGSVSLLFDVTDANGVLSGTEQFGLILTTDPSLAVIPEPATAALLAIGGIAALARRRRSSVN